MSVRSFERYTSFSQKTKVFDPTSIDAALGVTTLLECPPSEQSAPPPPPPPPPPFPKSDDDDDDDEELYLIHGRIQDSSVV